MATLANPTLGQSIFGHRVLPANFGQSIFGQNWCFFCHFGPMTFLANPFWANLCCVCCVLLCVVCVCGVVVVSKIFVGVSKIWVLSDLPPQFRSFFPSPATIFIFSSLLDFLSWNYVHVWALGLHTTTRELQTCTFQGLSLQTPPKFHEKTPKREKKERKLWREREKSAKFWAPTLRGGDHPSGRAPPFGAGPTFWGGPHLLGRAPPFGCLPPPSPGQAPTNRHDELPTLKTLRRRWPKAALAKTGQA